jgi:hypothetical protein
MSVRSVRGEEGSLLLHVGAGCFPRGKGLLDLAFAGCFILEGGIA